MKKDNSLEKLNTFLLALSNFERRLLRGIIQNADMIEGIQQKFVISDKELAKRMGMKEARLLQMKNGAVNYDLKHLAKLELIVKEEIEQSQLVEIRLSKKDK